MTLARALAPLARDGQHRLREQRSLIVEGRIFRRSIVKEKSLVVDPIFRVLAAGRSEIELIPDGRAENEPPALDLRERREMELLSVLRAEVESPGIERVNALVGAGAVLADHQRAGRPLTMHPIDELSEVFEFPVIPAEVEVHAVDVGNVAEALVVGELALRKGHHSPPRGILGVCALIESSR